MDRELVSGGDEAEVAEAFKVAFMFRLWIWQRSHSLSHAVCVCLSLSVRLGLYLLVIVSPRFYLFLLRSRP